MKKWYLAVLFLNLVAILTLVSGCGGGGGSSSTLPPSNEGITVLVEDAFTKAPLVSVTVKLGSQTLTTNSSGTAFTASLSPGIYDLKASKNGYIEFSTKVSCIQGRQFRIRLTPVLASPVTNEAFHQSSINVYSSAKGLQEAISLMNSVSEQSSQDPTVFFISASKAFTSAMDNALTYSRNKVGNSRFVLDALSNFLSLTKVAQGTEKIQQVKDQLYLGQDVPEINAWLAQNPYQGAKSLQELRSMYDNLTLETVVYPRLLRLYQLQSQDSGFNYALDGAKDIWCSQFTQVGEIFTNLIGWGVDKVWSGTKDLVINTLNYGQLVLGNTKQIVWLWEKGKQKLLIGEVENNKQMTIPQGTMDIIVSNGSKHKPYIVDNYQITGAGVQMISYTAESISTIPEAKVYIGQFSASGAITSTDASGAKCTYKHTVNISLRVELPSDHNYGSDGLLIANGTYEVRLVDNQTGHKLPEGGNFSLDGKSSQVWFSYPDGEISNFGSVTLADKVYNDPSEPFNGYTILVTLQSFDGSLTKDAISAEVIVAGQFFYPGGESKFVPQRTITLKRQ